MRMNMLRTICISGVFIFGCLTAGDFSCAQESVSEPERSVQPEKEEVPSKARVYNLGEFLIVTPVEIRNLLDTPTVESRSLDMATATVDEEMIRLQNADTLAESLQFSTAVFTEERGRKEKHLTSFRGQIYPYPDFAFNGVWQRAFWEIPSFFPASAIERVEILRSGGAIMVGPNSGLVGAVNIVPRRFEEPATVFNAQAGSFNTYRSSVVHGNQHKNCDYTFGLNHYSTEGPDNENAAEWFSSLFGTVAWDLGESIHQKFTLYGLTGERELRKIQDPGSKKFQNRLDEQFSPHKSVGSILRTLIRHNEISSTEFDSGFVYRDADYSYQPSDLTKPKNTSDEEDWEFNTGVIHARRLGDANTLRIGLQYNHWVSPRGKRFFVGMPMNTATFSLVAMDEHMFDRLTLDGGVRLTQSYYHEYTDASLNITGNKLSSRTIEKEWGEVAVTGTLGAEYRVNSLVSLYAHTAAGSVDAPPGGVSETGGSLEREMRILFDTGVRVEKKSLGSVTAGLFVTYRQDAVLLSQTRIKQDGETFNTYVNDDVRQYGLEIECRSAPIRNMLTLFGNLTAMNSQLSADGDWESYREIPDVIAAAGANVEVSRFDVNLFGKYVSGYENKRFAEDKKYHDLGDFVDLNLTAGVSFGKEHATRVHVAFENILDDEYSTVIGYPDYGFQFFGGIEHRF